MRCPAAPALLFAALALAGCDSNPIKDYVESHFKGFKGLDVGLKREYIVGLTPDQNFPNLHCCWVGTRSPWQLIGDVYKTDDKVEVNGEVLGALKSVGIKLEGSGHDYVSVEAKPFYRQQLLNRTHLKQTHCDKHEEYCDKKICVDSIKVGKVTVTVETEIGAGVGVNVPIEVLGKVEILEINGKKFKKETIEASDIIIAYQMAETFCGPDTAPYMLEESGEKVSSAKPRPNESYDKYLEDFRKDLEKSGQHHALAPGLPAGQPRLLEAALATATLAPPPEHFFAGQVVRLTPAASTYSPNESLRGVVVEETNTAGEKRQRRVPLDAAGGVWIALSAGTRALNISSAGRPFFSAPVSVVQPATSQDAPRLEQVRPFQGEAPSGLIESGSVAELQGASMHEISQVSVNGAGAQPLAAGDNWALARLEGQGEALIQTRTLRGFRSNPVRVTLVALSVEQRPPATLLKGQTSDVAIRVQGTRDQVPVEFRVRSGSIQLPAGAAVQRVMSSGGEQNLVRTSIAAQRAGAYDLGYRLTR